MKMYAFCMCLFIGIAARSEPAIPLDLQEGVLQTIDISVLHEAQRALLKALNWLQQNQNAEGYWSSQAFPGITALALTGFLNGPGQESWTPCITQGLSYLVACQKEDGGIYVEGFPNYNTSLAIVALVAAQRPEDEPILRSARNFVASLQDESGGIGYGSDERRDLNNTTYAIEALRKSAYLDVDSGKPAPVNWERAVAFLERCQNLPSHNPEAWASDDPENVGGFIYRPGESKAGAMVLENGKTAYRSYGSITYAGVLSMLFADLDRDDERVVAAVDWIKRHYTLDENPGLGPQSLYYYYFVMAKALTACGADSLEIRDGRKVNWRQELLEKLIGLQKNDGRWENEAGRWMEDDPCLVTSYALLSMEAILRGASPGEGGAG